MQTATTREENDITSKQEVLYVALELGKSKWGVASTTSVGQKPREVWTGGGHREGLR